MSVAGEEGGAVPEAVCTQTGKKHLQLEVSENWVCQSLLHSCLHNEESRVVDALSDQSTSLEEMHHLGTA